jgi:hypothetical protein
MAIIVSYIVLSNNGVYTTSVPIQWYSHTYSPKFHLFNGMFPAAALAAAPRIIIRMKRPFPALPLLSNSRLKHACLLIEVCYLETFSFT